MITIEKVKAEMADLVEDDRKVDLTFGANKYGAHRRHLVNIRKYEFLNKIALLLEHKPTEGFLQAQRTVVLENIATIEARYKPFVKDNPINSSCTLAEYRKLMGVPDLKAQLKNIDYILN